MNAYEITLQSSFRFVGSLPEVTQLHFRLATLLGTALIAFISLACNSTDRSATNAPASPVRVARSPQIPTVTADGVQRITTAELQEKLQKNEAVVIDVRTEASYKVSHIRGAKLIPHTEIAKRANELPRDKMIVTYCS